VATIQRADDGARSVRSALVNGPGSRTANRGLPAVVVAGDATVIRALGVKRLRRQHLQSAPSV